MFMCLYVIFFLYLRAPLVWMLSRSCPGCPGWAYVTLLLWALVICGYRWILLKTTIEFSAGFILIVSNFVLCYAADCGWKIRLLPYF
jgi:hypothetical protein